MRSEQRRVQPCFLFQICCFNAPEGPRGGPGSSRSPSRKCSGSEHFRQLSFRKFSISLPGFPTLASSNARHAPLLNVERKLHTCCLTVLSFLRRYISLPNLSRTRPQLDNLSFTPRSVVPGSCMLRVTCYKLDGLLHEALLRDGEGDSPALQFRTLCG